MHKKPGPGKKTGARIDLVADPHRRAVPTASGRPAGVYGTRGARGAPRSVNELLARGSKLRQIAHAIPEQQAWAEWLRERLPAELAAHVVNAVPKGTTGSAHELVLLADSAVWCARLRYALATLEAEIRERDATIARISVRVGR